MSKFSRTVGAPHMSPKGIAVLEWYFYDRRVRDIDIWRESQKGKSVGDISLRFGVSRSSVHSIVNRMDRKSRHPRFKLHPHV